MISRTFSPFPVVPLSLAAPLSRRRLLAGAGLAAVALGAGASRVARPAAAQFDVTQVAFTEEKLGLFGYPAFDIVVGPEGVTAPTEVAEGWYLCSIVGTGDYVGYVDFVIPPDGLDAGTMLALATDAASRDITSPDWAYAGGNSSFIAGRPTRFATYLRAGTYQMATSYFLVGGGSDETMRLTELTVTAPAGTPVAMGTPAAGAPPVDVRLEQTDDLRYLVMPEVVPAGPQIWEFTNTGTVHSHHTVMWQCADGTTAKALIADYQGLLAGTPPAADGPVAQQLYKGYAALQSGGYSTYTEFTLEPGTYSLTCFIANLETGLPHLFDGMVTVFTVE